MASNLSWNALGPAFGACSCLNTQSTPVCQPPLKQWIAFVLGQSQATLPLRGRSAPTYLRSSDVGTHAQLLVSSSIPGSQLADPPQLLRLSAVLLSSLPGHGSPASVAVARLCFFCFFQIALPQRPHTRTGYRRTLEDHRHMYERCSTRFR